MSLKNQQICFTLDPDLYALIGQYAYAHGVPIAAAMREILRTYLSVARSDYQNGWHEGYMAAVRAVREGVTRAMNGVIAEMRPENNQRLATDAMLATAWDAAAMPLVPQDPAGFPVVPLQQPDPMIAPQMAYPYPPDYYPPDDDGTR